MKEDKEEGITREHLQTAYMNGYRDATNNFLAMLENNTDVLCEVFLERLYS
jgi:hypothetical protein